jgi:trk system potassium uptake protein TrkA
MRIVIVGMGEVGQHVVAMLEREGHDVVAVDIDQHRLDIVEEHHDVGTVCGYGANPTVLKRAGAGEAGLVAAVTNDDEVNLVATLIARDLGAERVVARLQGHELVEGDEGVYHNLLGIDLVVNPQILVAQELARAARSHGALDVQDLAQNRLELVEMEIGQASSALNRSLADLKMPGPALIAAVVRDGDLFVPSGQDVLLSGDRLYLIGRTGEMDTIEDYFGGGREASRVLIIGGGVVGETLARILMKSGTELMILEQEEERAEELATKLPHVTVLQGDGTDLRLLQEENVEDYDLVCCVTHHDEINLMSALLARQIGAKRTATLVHRAEFQEIYRHLGVDLVLSPRVLASNYILLAVRQAGLESLHLLEEGQAEVLEFRAAPQSRVVGTPIARLSFPRGAIISGIVRGGEAIVPGGEDIIQADDVVVVLTLRATREAVERLFKAKVL